MPRKNLLGGQASGSAFSLLGNRSGGSSSRTYSGTQAERLAQARADDLPPQQPNSRKEATRELVRLLTTDDPKAQAAGKKAAAEGGFDVKTAADLGALIPVEGGGVADRALKVAGPLLKVIEVLGRPQQAVMELIQAAAVDTGLDEVITHRAFMDEDDRPTELIKTGNESTKSHNGGPSAAEIIGDAAGSGGYRDAWRALKGEKRWDPVSQSYTHDLSYVAALGADPDTIGKVGNVAGFIGGAALDPLNFVGAGEARTAAKVGEKGAALLADDAARELTPALARQLERQGIEAGAEKIAPEALQQALKRTGIRAGTTDAQRAAIRQALIDEAESGAGRASKGVISDGVKTVGLRGDRATRRGVRALTGKGERTGAERVAEDAIDSAMRYDRGGLRVGGRSILPEGVRAPIRGLVKDDIRQIGGVRAAQAVLDDAASQADRLDATAAKLTAKSDELLAQSASVPKALPDAVEGGRWHGSSKPIDDVAAGAYSGSGANNLYGPGFYTTDDVAIAGKYTKKGIGKTPTIYKVEWGGDTPAKFLNLDTTPVTPEIASSVSRIIEHVDAPIEDLAAVEDAIKTGAPIGDVYSKLRTAMSGAGLPKTEADDIFDSINYNIQNMGYDGFAHKGGVLTDGVRHNVEVYFPDVVASGKVRVVQQAAKDAPEALKAAQTAKGLNTRAANALAAAAKLRGTQDVGALLDETPWLGNVQTPVTETVARKVLPEFRPLEGKASKVREAFITRAGIKASDSLVPETADAVRESQILAAGTTKQTSEQGRRLLNQALKDIENIPPEVQSEVLKAMDIGGSLDDILPTLSPEAAKYATKLDELRNLTYDLNVDEKLADVTKFRARDDYMGRYVTPEASKALEKALKLNPKAFEGLRKFSTGKAATGQSGHLLARTVMPDVPLTELNDIVAGPLWDAGLLPRDVNAFELDPAKIVSRRFDDTLPALQFKRSVTDMQKSLKDTLGQDLVKVVDPGVKVSDRDFTRRGLQKIDLGPAGVVYAHPDIAPEISEFAKRTVTPEAVSSFGKTMDAWNRLWKSYATVPIITGTGFHTKNTIGNMFNNHLAGVGTYAYGEAGQIQKDIWQAKRAHPDLSVPDALAANGVDADRIAKVELALENQVLEEGFFNTDLTGKAELAIEGKRGRGARVAAKFDPRNPEQMFGVPTGRKVGEHIEDNARLAHFISKLDETGNAAQAAASVRKYLFDYGDLTPFERKVGKRVHAFYTFTRKNTPLQFEELVRNPAAANRLAALEQATLGGGEGSAGKDVPSFMGDIGGPIGRSQAGLLTGNKNGVVGNIDTPLDAASKTVDPLLFLAGKRSAMDTAQGVLGNVSGGPATAVKTAFEEATGRSAFTGGSLVDLEGKRRKNPVLSATDLFIPAISKGTRTLPALKNLATGEPGGETADSNRLIVIKALTGLGAKEVTPEMQKLARNEKLRSLRDIIDALKAADVDVPTIEELQTIGELKKTPRRKRAG